MGTPEVDSATLGVQLLAHYVAERWRPEPPAMTPRVWEPPDRADLDALIETLSQVGAVDVLTCPPESRTGVYTIDRGNGASVVVWLSMVLPYACVGVYEGGVYRGMLAPMSVESGWDELRAALAGEGFALLGEHACRAVSKYPGPRRSAKLTYFDLLFDSRVPAPWAVEGETRDLDS